jgi:hypothetical protein
MLKQGSVALTGLVMGTNSDPSFAFEHSSDDIAAKPAVRGRC